MPCNYTSQVSISSNRVDLNVSWIDYYYHIWFRISSPSYSWYWYLSPPIGLVVPPGGGGIGISPPPPVGLLVGEVGDGDCIGTFSPPRVNRCVLF
jgi:hypothetical protein